MLFAIACPSSIENGVMDPLDLLYVSFGFCDFLFERREAVGIEDRTYVDYGVGSRHVIFRFSP